MKTAVIAEDEILSGQRLKRLLESRGFAVLEIFQTASRLKGYLSENPAPEWLFLDIELRDGTIFKALGDAIKSRIIFTTAYDDRALEAIRHGGMDYLLKPIDAHKLDQAIDKITRLQHVLTPHVIEPQVRQIMVSAGKTLRKIAFPDILYFSSRDNVTQLHTADRQFVIGKSLDRLDQDLGDDFFRISRNCIVSRRHIVKVENSEVYLGIQKLTISRQRRKDFLSWFS